MEGSVLEVHRLEKSLDVVRDRNFDDRAHIRRDLRPTAVQRTVVMERPNDK